MFSAPLNLKKGQPKFKATKKVQVKKATLKQTNLNKGVPVKIDPSHKRAMLAKHLSSTAKLKEKSADSSSLDLVAFKFVSASGKLNMKSEKQDEGESSSIYASVEETGKTLPTACITMRNRFITNLNHQKVILRVFETNVCATRMVSHFPYKSCMDVYGCALSSMVGNTGVEFYIPPPQRLPHSRQKYENSRKLKPITKCADEVIR